MGLPGTQEAERAAAERRIRARIRAQLGAEVLRLAWLPAQLGLRRFARVWLRDGPAATLVARLEAPEDPAGRPAALAPEPRLEPLRTLLAAHGIPVPERYGGDDAGLDLLEDFGDRSLADVAREAPSALAPLYANACRIALAFQRVADPGGVPAFERRLDAALFDYKARLFCEWSLPSRGRPASPAERETVHAAFARIAEEAARAPQRLAHRDLQSANLLVPPGRPAQAPLGVIDFQGAFLAPPEYDLVCLLRDSYVELEPERIERLLAEVVPDLPDAPEAVRHRFALLTLTRKGKDHARFLYAARQRGDPRFLTHLPATVRALRDAAERARASDSRLRALAELIGELPCGP